MPYVKGSEEVNLVLVFGAGMYYFRGSQGHEGVVGWTRHRAARNVPMDAVDRYEGVSAIMKPDYPDISSKNRNACAPSTLGLTRRFRQWQDPSKIRRAVTLSLSCGLSISTTRCILGQTEIAE
jgi:hypothetical protein